ncbi:hypothetical protein Fmac_022570 [Flemingia macrophylla]|uniref:Uncharacterized protein n=1 Tax=Flemingia macrophylla TaxID=520843 RepID=A0ABD1M033_9FABA
MKTKVVAKKKTRLFGEAEEETDFFSSTTAASVYEKFLLTIGSIVDSKKGPDVEKANEQSSLSNSTKDVSSYDHQSCTPESVSPDSVSEAQRNAVKQISV